MWTPSDNQAKEIPFTVVTNIPYRKGLALSPIPCQPAQVIFSCM